MTEGNSGTKTLTFTITTSAASGRDVTVTYATANGTALAGSDYTGRDGHRPHHGGIHVDDGARDSGGRHHLRGQRNLLARALARTVLGAPSAVLACWCAVHGTAAPVRR